MHETAEEVRRTLKIAVKLLCEIEADAAGKKASPERWSPKEVLGHLIDSACNNQQKFVRTMEHGQTDFRGYSQEHWVRSQCYGTRDWSELVDLWEAYNRHLAHVIESVPPDKLSNTITIEGSGSFTLEFIIKDYVEHLKHHLLQIIPDAPLTSGFENVYNA